MIFNLSIIIFVLLCIIYALLWERYYLNKRIRFLEDKNLSSVRLALYIIDRDTKLTEVAIDTEKKWYLAKEQLKSFIKGGIKWK